MAASEGRVTVVEYLMRNGAGIHVRDRNNDTPLMCAINADQRAIIKGNVLDNYSLILVTIL